jgi:hypothetical protein
VGQQAVIANADAETPGNPPEQNAYRESLPSEHEERYDSANMKRKHEKSGDPVERLLKGSVA